jgi:glutamate dehydrogenase
MGITAKGAWESVKRHFRELGRNIQEEDFTVVGIGDMSGDVFGNGMLLSRTRSSSPPSTTSTSSSTRPRPRGELRRARAALRVARSSWSDYDPNLISEGGGVFSRAAKSVPLSPQVKELLGVEEDSLTPNEVIRALLKTQVDLLWNGGIGTYVKASVETNADVGDKTNDAVRINGDELRCRVVGEGGTSGSRRGAGWSSRYTVAGSTRMP